MASKIMQGDIVRQRDGTVAMVLRTGTHESQHPPPPPPPVYPSDAFPSATPHPIDRPIPKNHVGVSMLFARPPLAEGEVPPPDYSDNPLQVRHEKEYELLDRLLQPGDIVKFSHLNPESGIVTAVDIACKLRHVLTHEKVDEWVSHKLLEGAMKVEVGDRVIHGNWIGVVEQIFEEGLVETPGGPAWRIADMGGMMDPGRTVAELFPPDVGVGPPPLPGHVGPRDFTKERVVDIRPIVIHTSWIAINQKIPIADQDKFPKPKRFWSGIELHDLQLVTTMTDHLPRVGSKIRFRKDEDEILHGGRPTFHFETIHFRVYTVLETVTHVNVLWQSGKQTRERTTSLMLHANIDEYDCWPGDHVLVKGESFGDEGREAIVQTVDAKERTAEIRLLPRKPEEKVTDMLVSLLELDPHGHPPDTFGVGRGELVMISDRDNGSIPPRVPRIGQFEEQMEEGELRATMTSLGVAMAKGSEYHGRLNEQVDDVDWYGEVRDLRTEDGLIEVVLPNGKIALEKQENLCILVEEGEALPYDDEGPMDGVDGYEEDEYAGEWEDEEFDGEYDEEYELQNNKSETASIRMAERDEWEEMEDEADHEEDEVERITTPPPPPSLAQPAPTLAHLASAGASATSLPVTDTPPIPESIASSSRPPHVKDDPSWERFAILEEADASHHFFNQPVGKPNVAFLSRLQKEFKVLASSLPDTILVRSYEDRMDLLRVLIIGPPGTPYVDAPHLIDFYLDPTKYPFEPPKAHFHSWTSGRGRCSPNLYEEGKVCLSILGTWEGERNESWNPHKSSLLQIFVSIQGLVLVREPYFTEPAFEKLRGTKEARVSSRQYNEKAFVLTRGFILHALRHPIAGFADEMEHLYVTNGRLGSALKSAQDLITISEASDGVTAEELAQEGTWDEGDGVGRLTKGALIPLKRTITGLEALWAELRPKP